MEFPEPVIEVAVEPRSKADQEKMGIALSRLAAEDPSFRVGSDPESGQTVIKGMGELHLEIIVDRMKREFKVEANVGAPQVAYRETITRPANVDYTHKKQTGGTGQFARVKLTFSPGEKGSGFKFDSKIVGGSVPKEYIPGVQKGLESALQNGVIAGFPMVDMQVELTDGAYHEVDSSALAFEIASRAAFKEGVAKAGPQLLEPVMRVEVVTPEDYMGDIIGDLNSRRGQITGMEPRGNGQVINAMVPLATMFGYVNTLRSLSQGLASFTAVRANKYGVTHFCDTFIHAAHRETSEEVVIREVECLHTKCLGRVIFRNRDFLKDNIKEWSKILPLVGFIAHGNTITSNSIHRCKVELFIMCTKLHKELKYCIMCCSTVSTWLVDLVEDNNRLKTELERFLEHKASLWHRPFLCIHNKEHGVDRPEHALNF